MYFIKPYLRITLLVSLISLSTVAQANPVACFKTNAGNFCIELLETYAPKTVANFINYVNNDAYTSGVFHRSVTDFVIQGGGFKIVNTVDGNSLAAVETFAPIANEFKLSNTRGTVAMAKVGGDPDSATSQWFVSLADNSSDLDNQNGGFTVFGRIVFDGMTVIDAIGDLPIIKINFPGNLSSDAPTINFDGQQLLVSNFVQMNDIDVTDVSGILSEGSLSFAVDIGAGELLDVSLQLIEDSPSIVFELDPASVRPLQTTPINVATFSSQTGILLIPSVMIDSSTVVSDVFMKLTDPNTFQFTVQSFESAN